MQPVATDVTAAIGSLTGTNQYLNLIYAPRRDRGYDGPLQLYINAEAQLQTFDQGHCPAQSHAAHVSARRQARPSDGIGRLGS